jgi:hypothetical protein
MVFALFGLGLPHVDRDGSRRLDTQAHARLSYGKQPHFDFAAYPDKFTGASAHYQHGFPSMFRFI